jgi:hypothetical protein
MSKVIDLDDSGSSCGEEHDETPHEAQTFLNKLKLDNPILLTQKVLKERIRFLIPTKFNIVEMIICYMTFCILFFVIFVYLLFWDEIKYQDPMKELSQANLMRRLGDTRP